MSPLSDFSLRHDLLNDHVMKNLTSFDYLRQHGSYAPKLKGVFPAEDYPVWTSLATGLYPEEHNVVGDIMFNLRTRRFFNRSDSATTRVGDWWKRVEPFWSTAAKHGKKARARGVFVRDIGALILLL